jgi:hypothetical protein
MLAMLAAGSAFRLPAADPVAGKPLFEEVPRLFRNQLGSRCGVSAEHYLPETLPPDALS